MCRNRTWTQIFDLRRNGPPKRQGVWRTGSQGLKTLPVVSCCMKDNVKMIHFHIKGRSVHSLIFMKITCTTNFYFENCEVGIKTTIANLQPLLALNVSTCLRIFMESCLQWKRVFMKVATFFISSTRSICAKLLAASESSIKIKFRLHWRLFVILLTSAVTCKQRLLHEIEILQFL